MSVWWRTVLIVLAVILVLALLVYVVYRRRKDRTRAARTEPKWLGFLPLSGSLVSAHKLCDSDPKVREETEEHVRTMMVPEDRLWNLVEPKDFGDKRVTEKYKQIVYEEQAKANKANKEPSQVLHFDAQNKTVCDLSGINCFSLDDVVEDLGPLPDDEVKRAGYLLRAAVMQQGVDFNTNIMHI